MTRTFCINNSKTVANQRQMENGPKPLRSVLKTEGASPTSRTLDFALMGVVTKIVLLLYGNEAISIQQLNLVDQQY